MNRLEHKTTEEHYNKYRDMAKQAKIDIKKFCTYISCTVESLKDLYLEDSLLNNINLDEFDSYYYYFMNSEELRKIITNLADNVCVLKHLLIHEVLEIAPIFVNDKNYQNNPPIFEEI